MSVHLKHALLVAVSVFLTGAATWLASPAARSFIDHHPEWAAVFPLVAGLVDAFRKRFVSSGAGSGGTP